MSLAEWSPRRIVTIWAVGVALQVSMLVIPMLYATHLLRRDGPALRERVSAYREREQARQYRIAASGDTVFAVVGMPSGINGAIVAIVGIGLWIASNRRVTPRP